MDITQIEVGDTVTYTILPSELPVDPERQYQGIVTGIDEPNQTVTVNLISPGYVGGVGTSTNMSDNQSNKTRCPAVEVFGIIPGMDCIHNKKMGNNYGISCQDCGIVLLISA